MTPIRSLVAGFAALVLVGTGPAAAAELLMFRRAGCAWCHAWDKAIGPAYPNSDIGKRLPVRMVDLDKDPKPEVALAYPVRYTPTFVLVEGGREVGRIEGYPGDSFFWGLLERLEARLPPKS